MKRLLSMITSLGTSTTTLFDPTGLSYVHQKNEDFSNEKNITLFAIPCIEC